MQAERTSSNDRQAVVAATMSVVTTLSIKMAAVQALLPDGPTCWTPYDKAGYCLARVLANGGAELDVVVTLGESGSDAIAGAVGNPPRSFPIATSVTMCGSPPGSRGRLSCCGTSDWATSSWRGVDFDHLDEVERRAGSTQRNAAPVTVLKRWTRC